MPQQETLDEIAELICGQSFDEITRPDARIQVINLAIQAEINDNLYEVRRWFEKSKLFDGLS